MTPLPLKPFIEMIPAKDRQIIKHLECIFGAKVTIQNTDEGWRYDVEFPEEES